MNHQAVPKALVILEVSQKQAYIFGDKRLRENVKRSRLIDWVTDPDFFVEIAKKLFSEEKNLVYAGGGHTVLQLTQKEDAAFDFWFITVRIALNDAGEVAYMEYEYVPWG